MMWFFRHFWIFISYHIFLLNQVEGAIAIPPSNSAPLPLLSVRLSVRLSVNRSVNHIFRFLHICWQVTGKEWHRVRNADVSRWLTLGQQLGWVGLWGFLWWAPSAKRIDHPGTALDGAVFDIAQILAYLVHNMSRSQLYLGFGHFGWLPSFFGQ